MPPNVLHFSKRYPGAVKRGKPADLQRVAREYLSAENRTLYALLPAGGAPKPSAAVIHSTENAIRKFELAGGLRLLVKEDHRLPFVEFRAVFRGGVLAETASSNGLTQWPAKMLRKGTRRRDAERIVTQIESLGGSIESFGGNNSFGVSAEVLSGDFRAGLDLVADVLRNPVFPAAAFDRERAAQLEAIRDQKDQLLQSCFRAMRRALFGAAGYGLDSLGSEDSVQKLQVADLKAFHKRLVVPGNCVLAVYGDVNSRVVKDAVSRAFRNWPHGSGTPFQPTNLKLQTAGSRQRRVSEIRDKKQAVLVLGFPGATFHDQDRYALELIQEACSDIGSRMFLRIREKLGLAYYVGAQNAPGLVPGYFAFYCGTAPEKADEVERELLQETALLRAEGLSAEELKRAKAKVLGQRKLAGRALGYFATATALDEFYGLGSANTDAEDARYEA